MNSRVQTVLAALCVLLIVVTTVSACDEDVPEAEGEGKYSYLTGEFVVGGIVLTDEEEEIETMFDVSIMFRVVADAEGTLNMSLVTLNVLTTGVPTEKGDSGLIGLALVAPEYETPYDPSTGLITAEFSSHLHYELIDQIEGYQELEPEGENDVFLPYTEIVTGTLTGELPHNLQMMGNGEDTGWEAHVHFRINPDFPVLGSLPEIEFAIIEPLVWQSTGCLALPIQPVFIGTGSTDSNVTGTAFDDLMTRADEIWDRCGTVRCLKFDVHDPIYLDKPGYAVLDNLNECWNLLGEVNMTDAVEIFVVRNMSTALGCWSGGGISFWSGTASNAIVTCDQQLSVPCPCPVACQGTCPCGGCGNDTSTCGAVNWYHLAHELGHSLGLAHPSLGPSSTNGSIMEPSGFCCDNPDVQSARNCRNATNPLLRVYHCFDWFCSESPDIPD
jgi:hypothetical protein